MESPPGKFLEPTDSVADLPLLAPECGPAVRGLGGEDYLCGHCRRAVLVEAVPQESFFGLAFRCYECGSSRTRV